MNPAQPRVRLLGWAAATDAPNPAIIRRRYARAMDIHFSLTRSRPQP